MPLIAQAANHLAVTLALVDGVLLIEGQVLRLQLPEEAGENLWLLVEAFGRQDHQGNVAFGQFAAQCQQVIEQPGLAQIPPVVAVPLGGCAQKAGQKLTLRGLGSSKQGGIVGNSQVVAKPVQHSRHGRYPDDSKALRARTRVRPAQRCDSANSASIERGTPCR